MKPRLLDLFCGAGGAAMGYHRAGFDVVGVDINPQPNYPFEFRQVDAFKALGAVIRGDENYDAIHASPPCQGYSRMRHLPWIKGKQYPLLIDPVRDLLNAIGVPWVIENVEDAPMPYSSVLCGWSLGLPFYRHRRFGSSVLLMTPPHRRHTVTIVAGSANLAQRYRQGGGRDVAGLFPDATLADAGLEHMSLPEASQAIPPAYTEHIGRQLLEHIERSAA